MVRVVGIDHLVIRVGDYEKSKAFYHRLFEFLGFEVSEEYADAIGWTNGKTRFWIGPADAEGRNHKYRIGDVGFHHYACVDGPPGSRASARRMTYGSTAIMCPAC